MAATQAKAAFGYRFKRAGVDLAEVVALGGVSLKLDTKEVTHDASPGGWDEHIGTLLRGGDVPLTLNFLPADAGHIALRTDMTSRTTNSYAIAGPSALFTWTVTAQVVAYELGELTPDGSLEITVTLKITGQPTFA